MMIDQIWGVLLVLFAARLFGAIAERLHQTPSAGEIFGGVVLALLVVAFDGGPLPLGQLTDLPALQHVAEMGIFFIILVAGLELKPREIAAQSAGAFIVALCGVIVPFAMGVAAAWYLLPASADRGLLSLLIGVSMSVTAIAATAKVFADFGLLRGRAGELVIAAAVIDDVIGLVLLALLTAVIQSGGVPGLWDLLWLLGKVGAFFAITVVLGVHVYPRVRRGLDAVRIATLELSALIAVALAYAMLAHYLGMHAVLGAFMAGLFFEPARVGAKAYNEIRLILTAITSGLLGPVFFASIGLHIDFTAVSVIPGTIALLIVIAIAGKLLGAGLPALALGLRRREAAVVGLGMSARGEIELIVLSVAFQAGLFGDGDPVRQHLFSALILMAVVTTLFTPISLRLLLRPKRRATRHPRHHR